MFSNMNINEILLLVVPVLLGLCVHEYAHALAAHRLGDNTAKNAGRLTLNPLAHLDFLGTLMLFFSQLFGWAKPVPFNPGNFRNPVRDTTLVALAGPVSNFILALAAALLLKILIYSGIFKSLDPWLSQNLATILYYTVLINISLGLFNLLPFPPLDGFKVLSYFLPADWVAFAYRNTTILVIIFLVLMVTGVLSAMVAPAFRSLAAFFIGLI